MWRENYLKYKHFLTPGAFIALKGRIEVPPRRSELEFVISSIDMLQDLREQRANSLHIKLSSKAIDQVLISDLNKLFMEHEGKCSLHFNFGFFRSQYGKLRQGHNRGILNQLLHRTYSANGCVFYLSLPTVGACSRVFQRPVM